jgi:L-lysine 2,3-aminomutase
MCCRTCDAEGIEHYQTSDKGRQMTWKRLRRWLSGLFQSKPWTGDDDSPDSGHVRRDVDAARTRMQERRW